MRFIYSFFIVLCLGALPSFAATEIPERFLTLIDNIDEVTVDVKQEKYIAELDQTFKSSGTMQFKKKMGLIWDISQPTPIHFVATTDTYWSGDQSKKLKDLPRFSDISRLIKSIENGNLGDLERAFEIDFSNTDIWELTLNPTQSDICRFIRKIIVKGNDAEIKSIQIIYQNDDEIIFHFTVKKRRITNEIMC